MTTKARLADFMIDCPAPRDLVRFYSELADLTVLYDEDTYGGLETANGSHIYFQQVQDYQRPDWPNGTPQQFHLDFRVDDLATSVAAARALGATEASFQPGNGAYVVMLDPAGHPFCLCPEKK